MRAPSLLLVLTMLLAAPIFGQSADNWSIEAGIDSYLRPNITYLTADGYESKLDVMGRRDRSTPAPVLIYFHGGGWVGGTKESSMLSLLPWLEMGFSVVNVEYRMAGTALAPAAVEDTRCALRWVYSNAEEYGFDTKRIVTSGHSAGGHLSLITAMLPAEAGLDRRCPVGGPGASASEPEMPVAAIVNWFGITDVGDLLAGENAKTYAIQWFGSTPNRDAVAKRVSPLTYVRAGLPPTLTIHGDADPVVPYDHGVQLHAALDQQGVPNRLHTVQGGGHGGFSPAQTRSAFAAIREFLTAYLGD